MHQHPILRHERLSFHIPLSPGLSTQQHQLHLLAMSFWPLPNHRRLYKLFKMLFQTMECNLPTSKFHSLVLIRLPFLMQLRLYLQIRFLQNTLRRRHAISWRNQRSNLPWNHSRSRHHVPDHHHGQKNDHERSLLVNLLRTVNLHHNPAINTPPNGTSKSKISPTIKFEYTFQAKTTPSNPGTSAKTMKIKSSTPQ